MSIKKGGLLISKNEKKLFSKAFSPMEVSFCLFVKSSLDDNDFETANNAFSKYGQFICPELDSESCIFIAKSRYEYLIGLKTEAEWFNDLKNSVCEIEGVPISISRNVIDIDFLISKNNKTNDENFRLGNLFYEILNEDKKVIRDVEMKKNDYSKYAFSFLYALRLVEGDGSLLNPIDFRDYTLSFFRSFNGKETSFDNIKDAVFLESNNMFRLISKNGVVESQFSLAESGRCDDESAKTKAEIFKSYADKCLFLSSIAVSLGCDEPDIVNMYMHNNNINCRIKKVLDRICGDKSSGMDINI